MMILSSNIAWSMGVFNGFLGNRHLSRARKHHPLPPAQQRDRRRVFAGRSAHAADREAFLVVSGRYEFDLDGRVEVHGPGALVRVPDGKPHSFRNVGEEDSAMMIMTWPGRGHDEFFATVGEPLLSGETRFPEGGPPPDIPAIVEAAKRCGIELLLPA
jgi:mannose-6-phosphate isomerase-like protein (cupin superfamily)